MGDVLISKKIIKHLNLKNIARISAVYLIENNENFTISHNKEKGKIRPEEIKDVCLNFLFNEEKLYEGFVKIHIRASKIIKIPFVANVVIPDIYIL